MGLLPRGSGDGSLQEQTLELPCNGPCSAMADMWRAGQLCDVVLRSYDGAQVPCHRLALAAGCGYFRALFTGAGMLMADGGSEVVELHELAGEDLQVALAAVYDQRVQASPANLERILYTASFLEMPGLLTAACQYMRACLGLGTCVPLLQLASRYSLLHLRTELLAFVCSRFCNLSSSNAEGLPGAQCSFELGQPLAEAHGCSSLPPPPRQQQQQQQQQHAACWHDQRHQEQHLQQPQQQWQSGHGDQALTHQGACSTSASTCALASSPGPVPGTSCVSAPSLTPPCAAACQFSALVSLPMELLAEVLRSDELSVDSEAEVLQVVLDWAAYRLQQGGGTAEEAARQLPDLLSAVRLADLPRSVSLCCPSPSHRQAATLMANLLAAAQPPQAPRTPEHQPSGLPGGPALHGPVPSLTCTLQGGHASVSAGLAVSGARGLPGNSGGSGRSRRHRASALLAVGGYDGSWRSLRSAELYCPRSDAWSPGPALTLTALGHVGCVSALPRGEVYLVGGSPFCSQAARLRPSSNPCPGPAPNPSLGSNSNSNSNASAAALGAGGWGFWEACCAPVVPRAHAGIVAAATAVLAVGGRSQVQQVQQVLRSVELYVPGSPAWVPGPDMAVERSAMACATLGGQVYAIGGAGQRSAHRSVEVFDLGSERWLPLASPLATERKYASAAVLDGRLFVGGGINEQRTRLTSMEALDPREGKWQVVAHMAVPRSSCGMAVLQGKLYIVGGQAGDTSVHDLVECLEPSVMCLRRCAPLGCGRSGLGLCAL